MIGHRTFWIVKLGVGICRKFLRIKLKTVRTRPITVYVSKYNIYTYNIHISDFRWFFVILISNLGNLNRFLKFILFNSGAEATTNINIACSVETSRGHINPRMSCPIMMSAQTLFPVPSERLSMYAWMWVRLPGNDSRSLKPTVHDRRVSLPTQSL